jgi:hypothetical protein
MRFSLSLRERAGVRGKEAIFHKMITILIKLL